MSKAHGFVPKSLSKEELRKIIIDAIENAPSVDNLETFHARYDHMERGITVDDVVHGLEGTWTFERPPEFNKDHWQWKYRLAGKTIDEEALLIVVAVDTANRTFEVITRWNPEETD